MIINGRLIANFLENVISERILKFSLYLTKLCGAFGGYFFGPVRMLSHAKNW